MERIDQKMKKLVYTFLFAVPCAVSAAVSIPEIEAGSVTCVQKSTSRKVEIGYRLKNAPAIVTIDIMTNGVSIGGEHLSYLSGDVNKVVYEGGNRLITWMPNKAWPGDKVAENVTVSVTAWATNAPPDWMVVSLVDTNGYVRYYAEESTIPFGVENNLYKTEQMVFRKIPAANVCYRFGSPMTEKGRSNDKEAAQMITLKDDFYLGIYEVTQRQYELITGKRPAYFKNDSCYRFRPVENLSVTAIRGSGSWPDGGHIVADDSFMGILGDRTGLYGFDLPTEAEWEFAARASCGNALYNGKELTGDTTSDNLDDIARYRRNGGYATGASSEPASNSTVEHGTADVGSFDRNAYGLYDMLGNVWERCLDRYIDFPTVGELEAGGPGDRGSTSSRTIRGGSWKNDASSIRSASRNGVGATSSFNHTGFRVWRNAVVR